LAATFAMSVTAVPLDVSAAETSTLPILSPCKQTTTPALPARWRAVGLMMPFVHQQIDVGEFIYDGTIPAMRATLYGLESGAVDILISSNETYQLLGPHDSPNACVALGPKYAPPPARWLTGEAVCDGEAPLAKTDVQWWKTSDGDGRARWQWYKTETRLPWR